VAWLPAGLAVLLPACAAGAPPTPPVVWQRHVALPVLPATALVAAAVRHALPFADPEPHAAGAPATVRPDGSGEVHYVRRDRGFAPQAHHRLAFGAGTAATEPGAVADLAVTVAAGPPLTVEPVARGGSLRITITAAPGGAQVWAELPHSVAALLADRLGRSLDQAEQPDRIDACLAEPQLAAFVAQRLFVGACGDLAQGDARAAERRLVRAMSLGGRHVGAAQVLLTTLGRPMAAVPPPLDPVLAQAWLRAQPRAMVPDASVAVAASLFDLGSAEARAALAGLAQALRAVRSRGADAAPVR
jgi:hypothetical protein